MLTGGDKDITAPALLAEKTIPANYSTHFNSSTIRIQFNEYIQLKNLKKNFFVNPPIEKIKVEEKGGGVIIHLEEALIDNTTYTFNFGNSIQDITENNSFKDFKYVMSTGSYLDSSYYAGFVYDAFSKKPIENATLFFYKEALDSFPSEKLPSYLGYSNKLGDYKLENLKKGDYYVFAIKDNNNNSKFDEKSEKMGFKSKKISSSSLSDSASSDTLILFNHDFSLKIKDKKYIPPGKIVLIFNKKVKGAEVNVEDHEITFLDSKENGDSLVFWLNQRTESDVAINVAVKGQDFKDKFKLTTYSSKAEDSIFDFKAGNLNNINPQSPLNLIFDQPIKSVNSNKIKFYSDSIKLEPHYKINKNLWDLEIPEEAETEYKFIAEPGAFVSIYNFKNDTIELLFERKSEDSYGTIVLNVSCERTPSYIVELIKNEKVIKSFIGLSGIFSDTIQHCIPGNYSLRIIEDEDGNGKWTTGDFANRLQPEVVNYYTEAIEVRPGWDMEIKWFIK